MRVPFIILYMKKSPLKIIAVVAIVVLVVAGSVFAWRALKSSDEATLDQAAITETESNGESVNREGRGTVKDEAKDDSDSKTPSQNNQSNTSNSSAGISINSYYDTSLKKAIVKGIVTGTSKGTCVATFTKGSQKITSSAPVEVVTSYIACGDLNVARSKFPSAGTWSVQVALKGTSVKSEVNNVNVK